MECSQLPSVASVRRPRDQSKLEQTKAQSRKPHSISAPELRISRADHNPAPGAQGRLRRVFMMLLRHAVAEGLPVGDEDCSLQDREEFKVDSIDTYHQCDDGQLKKRLAQAERDLQTVHMEETRAITLCVKGTISDVELDQQRKIITQKLETLRAKLDECLGQVAAAAEAYDVSRWTERVCEGLNSLTSQERKQAVLLLLDHLTIDGQNGVSITMAVPVKEFGAVEDPPSCL